jgi:hypothetical protein
MKTLIANLRHASRNHETVSIGGGQFGPDEVGEALAQYSALKAAAALALEALQWTHGGEPIDTMEAHAIEALKQALKDV